jgi:hypothetical protein
MANNLFPYLDKQQESPQPSSGLGKIPMFNVSQNPTESNRIGRAQSFVSNIGRGAANVVASIPQAIPEAASALGFIKNPEETSLYKAGEDLKTAANKALPVNPEYQEEFSQKLGQGLGSMTAFLAGGELGAIAKVPRLLSTAAAGAAAGGMEGVQDIKNTAAKQGKEVKPEDRSAAFMLNAATGLSEAAPIGLMFNRLDKLTNGSVKKAILAAGIRGAGEEGLQEAFQNISQNLIANKLVGYDPERNTFTGTADNAAVGGTIGFLMNTLASSIGHRRAGKFEQAAAQADLKNTFKGLNTPQEIQQKALEDRMVDHNDKPVDPITGSALQTGELSKAQQVLKSLHTAYVNHPEQADAYKAKADELIKSINDKFVNDIVSEKDGVKSSKPNNSAPVAKLEAKNITEYFNDAFNTSKKQSVDTAPKGLTGIEKAQLAQFHPEYPKLQGIISTINQKQNELDSLNVDDVGPLGKKDVIENINKLQSEIADLENQYKSKQSEILKDVSSFKKAEAPKGQQDMFGSDKSSIGDNKVYTPTQNGETYDMFAPERVDMPSPEVSEGYLDNIEIKKPDNRLINDVTTKVRNTQDQIGAIKEAEAKQKLQWDAERKNLPLPDVTEGDSIELQDKLPVDYVDQEEAAPVTPKVEAETPSQPEIQPTDILTKTNRPFKDERAAKRYISNNKLDAEVAPVKDGFVVRPKQVQDDGTTISPNIPSAPDTSPEVTDISNTPEPETVGPEVEQNAETVRSNTGQTEEVTAAEGSKETSSNDLQQQTPEEPSDQKEQVTTNPELDAAKKRVDDLQAMHDSYEDNMEYEKADRVRPRLDAAITEYNRLKRSAEGLSTKAEKVSTPETIDDITIDDVEHSLENFGKTKEDVVEEEETTAEVKPKEIVKEKPAAKKKEKVIPKVEPDTRPRVEAEAPPKATPKQKIEAKKVVKETLENSTVQVDEIKAEYSIKLKAAYLNGYLTADQYTRALDVVRKGSLKDLDPIFKHIDTTPENPNIAFQTSKKKVGLGINFERMIAQEGANLYKAGIVEVNVKEMFQNSFDAIKGALSQGQIEHGNLDIILDRDARTIAVRDNGVGMNMKTVEKAFLTLWGSEKEGLTANQMSGGKGKAKMAFLLGNAKVQLDTVKDGQRITFSATPEQFYSSEVELHTEKAPKVPNGTTVTVTVPESVVDDHGETKDIWFPSEYDVQQVSVLSKPLLEDRITITVGSIYNDKVFDSEKGRWVVQKKISGEPLESFSYEKNPFYDKVTFDWGYADIYIGNEYKEYPKINILSSGIWQFDAYIRDLKKVLPHNVIIDVHSNVETTDRMYPFNHSREGFSGNVEQDIGAMYKYLENIGRVQRAEETVNRFKDFKQLPLTDVDTEADAPIPTNEIKSFSDLVQDQVEESKKIQSKTREESIKERDTTKGKTVQEIMKEFMSDIESETGKDKEKGIKESFKSGKELKTAKDMLIEMGVDDKLPVYHNNTNIDWTSINPGATRLFSELGTVLTEVRDFMKSNSKVIFPYGNDSFKDNPLYVGISLDKEYKGVNIKVPYSGIFLNPLWNEGTTIPGIVEDWYQTIIHEFVHEAVRGHDESFIISLHEIMGRMAESAKDIEIRNKLRIVAFKNRKVLDELRTEFRKFSTKNVSKSLKQGEKDETVAQGVGHQGSNGISNDNAEAPNAAGESSRSGSNRSSPRKSEVLQGIKDAAAQDATPSEIIGTTSLMQKGYGQLNEAGHRKYARQLFEGMSSKAPAFLQPLGKLAGEKYYNLVNSKAMGGIYKGEQMAVKLAKALKPLSKAQRQDVMEYFTTAGASADNMMVPVPTRKLLEEAKQWIADYGRNLVDQGLLQEDTYQENLGTYLPRMYYKYMVDGYIGSGKKPSLLNYLKERSTDLSPESQAALGKIEDPEFILPMTVGIMSRDIALLNMFDNIQKVSQNQKLAWVLNEENYVEYRGKNTTLDFVERELAHYEELLKDGIGGKTHGYTPESYAQVQARRDEAQEAVRIGTEKMKAHIAKLAAESGENLSPDDYLSVHYERMPRKYRFGKLSNMYVRKEIKQDLADLLNLYSMDTSNPFINFIKPGGTLDNWNQMWKAVHTTMNPPTVMRNAVGNLIMLDMSTSTPMPKLLKMLYEEVEQNMKGQPSRFLKLAKDMGAFGTTFSGQELGLLRSKYIDIMNRAKAKDTEHPITSITFALQHKWHAFIEFTSEVYGDTEGIFKTLKMRDHIETWEKQNNQKFDKLDPVQQRAIAAEAINEANKWLFDYSKVPAFVRTLRRTPLGAPFLSFIYKSFPRIVEGMMTRPEKFMKYVALPSLMIMAFYAANPDLDDEDRKRIVRDLPMYTKDKSSVMLLPVKRNDGKWYYLDMSYMYPFAPFMDEMIYAYNHFEGANAAEGAASVGGEALHSLHTFGFLGGPVPSMVAALTTNKDPFLQKDIVNQGDPASKQLADVFRYMTTLALPGFLASHGLLGRTLDNLGIDTGGFLNEGKQFDKTGRDAETGLQTAMSGMGLTVKSVYPTQSRLDNLQFFDKQIKDTTAARNKALEGMKGNSQERIRIFREYNEKLQRLRDERGEYLKGK